MEPLNDMNTLKKRKIAENEVLESNKHIKENENGLERNEHIKENENSSRDFNESVHQEKCKL